MNKIGLILLFLIFLCANSSAQEKGIRNSGTASRYEG